MKIKRKISQEEDTTLPVPSRWGAASRWVSLWGVVHPVSIKQKTPAEEDDQEEELER